MILIHLLVKIVVRTVGELSLVIKMPKFSNRTLGSTHLIVSLFDFLVLCLCFIRLLLLKHLV